MDKRLAIVFHQMDRSESTVSVIKQNAEQLEHIYNHIIAMKVKIEKPHQHHRHGNRYRVVIEMTLPRKRLVTSRTSDRLRNEELLPAINDAFHAMARQLETYARERRGDVKHHDWPSDKHAMDEKEIYDKQVA